MRTLYWVRNDLRVNDNTALFNAAKKSKEGIIAVFFVTTELWRKKGYGQNKINFILNTLNIYSADLSKLNISLLISYAKNEKEIADQIIKTATQYQCDALFYNRSYELNEIKLEEKVTRHFANINLQFFSFDDETILPPGNVRSRENKYYSIFTPFKNQWVKEFKKISPEVLPAPKKHNKLITVHGGIKKSEAKTSKILSLWPAGETEAKKRLRIFIENKVTQYNKNRDFPVIDGTSSLSPYLAIGAISPRQCLKAAIKANNNKLNTGNKGIITWINELIWRDFYKHLIHGFQYICTNQSFKAYGERIQWSDDKKLFNAWKNGKTGFPIIDAAMRQLLQKGWMHNRLRMVTASFLTKLLLIDWRWGENYFAENLIDYDFSSNNGGWQWAASTGADSMPYFRIFNPILQSQKYDPNGDFIRQYCPEYHMVKAKEIHLPKGKAIVEYKVAKEKAIKIFKNATTIQQF
jgi:deoxyribodipyrimidine photo-lyase